MDEHMTAHQTHAQTTWPSARARLAQQALDGDGAPVERALEHERAAAAISQDAGADLHAPHAAHALAPGLLARLCTRQQGVSSRCD